MHSRLGSISVLILLISIVALWSLTRTAHANAAASSAVVANEAIAKAMKEMNAALESLGKGVTAANKDASLEALAKFETAVIAAKGTEPGSAAKVDEKKRSAFVADYRKTLLDALKFAADAEAAVVDGKYKEADTLIRNRLGGLKASGHGKFKGSDGK